MPYRLGRDDTVAEGVRPVVAEQLLEAAARLRGDDPVGAVVHDARRHLKMARATLKVVRSGPPKDVYRIEHLCYRDAGRELAAVRDARVLVDTIDGLRASASSSVEEAAFDRVRRALRSDVVSAQRVFRRNAVREGRADTLTAASRRAAAWTIEDGGWSELASRLQRCYRGGVKARARAREKQSDEAFHAWRKLAKKLWHCERLPRGAWPELMRARAKASGELADILGWEHDLALLRSALLERHFVGDGQDVEALSALALQRSRELRSHAERVARRVYAEPASAYVERVGVYFRQWRRC